VDRAATHSRRTRKKDKKYGSFEFTLTFIVFTFTVLYKIYDFSANNPIPKGFSVLIIPFSYFIGITFVFMFVSLLMKATSLGFNSEKQSEYFDTYATDCYLAGCSCGILCLIYLTVFLVLFIAKILLADIIIHLLSISDSTFVDAQNTLSVIIMIIIVYVYFSKNISEKIFSKIQHNMFYLTICGSFVAAVLMFIFLNIGNITVEMNDIYSKQNEEIPIQITTTGVQYNDVVINLSGTDNMNNLESIDSIKIKSTSDRDKMISGKYLTGNNLDWGKFKVYINSKNLTKGYYELSVTTEEEVPINTFIKMKSVSFYLT
jgi:hypothetical protein